MEDDGFAAGDGDVAHEEEVGFAHFDQSRSCRSRWSLGKMRPGEIISEPPIDTVEAVYR